MNDTIRVINTLIIDAYGKHCSVVREDPLENSVVLFDKDDHFLAESWLKVLNEYEFSTLTVEPSEKNVYSPVLIYSNDVDIVRETYVRS